MICPADHFFLYTQLYITGSCFSPKSFVFGIYGFSLNVKEGEDNSSHQPDA